MVQFGQINMRIFDSRILVVGDQRISLIPKIMFISPQLCLLDDQLLQPASCLSYISRSVKAKPLGYLWKREHELPFFLEVGIIRS